MLKYKSTFLVLVLSFLITTQISAQFKLASSGNTSVGGSPNSNYKLYVPGGSSNRVSIRAYTTGSSSLYTQYGVQGLAYGSGLNHRGVWGAAMNGSVSNYGIYGTASGSNNWAGYFSGNVYATGSYSSSDRQLKKNISFLNGQNILTKLIQLNPVSYQFLSEAELRSQGLPSLNTKEGNHLGLIAQEVEKIFPEVVIDVVSPLTTENGEPDPDGKTVTTKAINYNELIAALIAAVQEQQAQIEKLENQLNAKTGQ